MKNQNFKSKKFAVICQYHENCNLSSPSRNNNPFGISGMIYEEFNSYKEAKNTQKYWVREKTEMNGVPDLRENSINCGDCTIYIISEKEIYELYNKD